MGRETIFIYILFATTSTIGFALAVTRFGLDQSKLRPAFFEIMECIGAAIVFFAVNAVAGLILILAIRRTFGFFSLYTVTDFSLVALSAVQGFLFQRWWRKSRG